MQSASVLETDEWNKRSLLGILLCQGGIFLEGTYDILMGGEKVGQAKVEQQGLYYRFSCRCRISGEVICRVCVSCGAKTENLGVLVPMGSEFGLEKKLAVKKLGRGLFRFRAGPKHSVEMARFVPVYPEEPFSYLSKLQNAFLEIRNEEIGVLLP